MQSVDEDVVIKKDCAEILDLLHTNIDTVWEKAKVNIDCILSSYYC